MLQRTLASGIIDEYGWPIVEEIAEKLGKKGKQEVTVYGRFPYVMITDGLKVVVVDRDKVILEHELQMPKKAKLNDMMFYDGQLGVYLETDHYQNKFYWSANPKKTKDCYHYSRERIGGAVVDLKDGGTFIGRKTVHAGDAENPETPNKFLYDGEHFWRLESREGENAFREADAKTGKEGRWSTPSFLEDFLGSGDKLEEFHCELLHYGDAVKGSPLGSKDGKIGWRVKKTQAGKFHSEGIDGRSWQGQLRNQSAMAMVDQPGTSKHLPLTGNYGWSWGYNRGFDVWDPSGQFEVAHIEQDLGDYNRGQAASFPPLFWHAFQIRDEKTSKALRGIKNDQAKKLLAAALADLDNADEENQDEDPLDSLKETQAAVKKWLPGLKHTRLERGLLGVIHKAGKQAQKLAELVESRDPEGKETFSHNPALEALVEPAMDLFGIHAGYGGEPLFPHLADVKAFIEGEKTTPNVSAPPFDWWELLKDLDCRAWAAYWSAKEDNDAWLKFLEHWADLGICDLPGKFRKLDGNFGGAAPIKAKSKKNEDDWIGYHYQDNVYFLSQQWDEDWQIFEYAPKGKFQLLPKYKIEEEEKFESTWSGEQIREFVAEAKKNPKPFLDTDKLKSIADQLGITPAEMGLVWFGFPNFNSWGKTFLSNELRESLKIKVKEAESARQSLKAMPDETRQKLLKSLLAGPPKELWEDGGAKALNRLVSAWEKIVPKRLAVPPKVLDQLTSTFPYHVDKSQLLTALAAPKSHPMFTADAKWSFHKGKNSYGTDLCCDEQGQTFDASVLKATAISIPFLNYNLPVGEPRERTCRNCTRQRSNASKAKNCF